MMISETKHKGYTIKVFFDQECFGYLVDIFYPTFTQSINSKPNSFKTEDQALEYALDWIDELSAEYYVDSQQS